VITSILNTKEEVVEIQDPLVELNKIEPVWSPTGALKKSKRIGNRESWNG
jgi:hypothetical protein